MRRLLLTLLLAAGPALAQDAWQPRSTADLILLDKIRAQPTPLQVKVGDSTGFGSLTLRVQSCMVRPPDQPADATAFIEVTDSREKGSVFRGWILANTPAVSQVEHPIYDVRLAGCH